MNFFAKAENLRNFLRRSKKRREPVVYMVIGSGLSAISAWRAHIPFFMVLNAGLYRTVGVISHCSAFSFGNANDQTIDLIARQILPRCSEVPLVAGLFPLDPTQALEDRLEQLKKLGVAGIVNWPCIGILGQGKFVDMLRREGFTEKAERQMLEKAREAGFVTMGFVSNPSGALEVWKSRPDALVLNAGWAEDEGALLLRRPGSMQRTVHHINDMIATVRAEAEALREPEPAYLYTAGEINAPPETMLLYSQTDLDGFGAGGAYEFFPIRRNLQNLAQDFMSAARKLNLRSYTTIDFPGCIGSSDAMLDLHNKISQAAKYDVTVSLFGETGTGKEMAAKMIHSLSSRKKGPFITLN